MSNPFQELADTWWDTEGPFKTLHDINPCRMGFMQQYVDFNQKEVLDLGCGGGILSEAIAKVGAKVTGLDIEESLIHVAKTHAHQENLNITYQAGNVEDFNHQGFDIIVCMEMLEHVESPGGILKECRRLLKPGGMLFLSTINRTLKAYVELILMGEYVLNLLPRQTHDYKHFIQPAELAQYLREQDFELLHLKGMGYNPIIRQSHLKDGVDVNYLMMAKVSN